MVGSGFDLGPKPRSVLRSQCWENKSFPLLSEDFQSALDSCGNWEWGTGGSDTKTSKLYDFTSAFSSLFCFLSLNYIAQVKYVAFNKHLLLLTDYVQGTASLSRTIKE